MTICCVSDTHGQEQKLDLSEYPADVLVHAGDFVNRGTKTEVINFLQWLELQDYQYKIFISGNHSGVVASDPEWFKRVLKTFPAVTYLQDSEVVIEGIKFYGSPYSPEFCNWDFMEEEIDLSKIWDKIPDDTDVLLTHSPAYGCHDLVERAYGRDPHVGSQSLTYRKKALQDSLRVHVCGHIHCAYGTSNTLGCLNINASVLNDDYQLVNKPIIVEI